MPISRYTRLPLTLYRIQSRLPVSLRDFASQQALKRASFDLKLHDGKVLPLPPNCEFETPNGMSLRPRGPMLKNILTGFKGNPTIYTLISGSKLPEGLCVFHEHSDHFSMQTTEKISLLDFNQKLTEFLQTLPSQTKDEFLEMLEDEEDQDN